MLTTADIKTAVWVDRVARQDRRESDFCHQTMRAVDISTVLIEKQWLIRNTVYFSSWGSRMDPPPLALAIPCEAFIIVLRSGGGGGFGDNASKLTSIISSPPCKKE